MRCHWHRLLRALPTTGKEQQLKKLTTFAVIAVTCLAAVSHASTPFSVTQTPNMSSSSPGVISDAYALNGSGGQGFNSADSFDLTVSVGMTYYITSITTYGFGYNGSGFSPASLSAIEINLFGNSGSTPGATPIFNLTYNPATAPEVTHTSNGSIGGFNSYKTTYDLSAAPINMGTGGTFWLNVGGTGTGSSTYAWNLATMSNGNAFRSGQSTMWGPWVNTAGAGLAYEIGGYTESVPEPATLALGLLLIPALRKRKQS